MKQQVPEEITCTIHALGSNQVHSDSEFTVGSGHHISELYKFRQVRLS